MGFDKGEDGRLIINEEQAEVVRRIYREFLEGFSYSAIAARLNEDGVPGVSGKPKWLRVTIKSMLQNEKYKGDSLLQKTYTADFLTKKQVKNEGQVTQYYIKDSHDAIIPKEEWEAVQLEIARQEKYKADHHMKQYGYGNELRPFNSKIVCGECGSVYSRKQILAERKNGETCWACNTRSNDGVNACGNDRVRETVIQKVFTEAWNSAVRQRDTLEKHWAEQMEKGSPLEKIRASQMLELTAQGEMKKLIPEIVQTVLECIVVKGDGVFEVHFLDGTGFELRF